MQSNAHLINSLQDLEHACAELIRLEPRFGELQARNGTPRLRTRPAGLEGLAWIVTGQLISAQAAQAIWQRVHDVLHPFDAERLADLPVDKVAAAGLTKAKASCIIGAAQAVSEGSFSFDELAPLNDDAASARLMQLKGIGRWSADIYLMTCLGRPDAWPTGDLAVRAGVQSFLGLKQLPPIGSMDDLAKSWRPWRAVAARYLWDHYLAERGLKGL
jgi:DNA-3-methyladenine glycosylase II